MEFFPSSTQKAPTGVFREADGKTYVYAIAHAALTAKTGYLVILNEYGPVTIAQADGAFYCYVGFPNDTVASGALAKLQIGGLIEDAITPSLSVSVGHAFKLYDGAIADVGSDYTGAASEFAACVTESSSSTTQDMMLCGHMILTTT
jgi:hypothetical protein